MTLYLLTLPAIGICERYGLPQMAIELISRIKNATVGKIFNIYALIREVTSAMSLRLGGHPQFIRPLINPMAQGAAISKYGKVDEKYEDKIKGQAAAMDNYGNFFRQNIFLANPGVLLEGFYALTGILMILTALFVIRDTKHKTRIGTVSFWTILGIIFIFGKYIPSTYVGGLILIIGVLTVTKQVNIGNLAQVPDAFSKEQAKRIGGKYLYLQ